MLCSHFVSIAKLSPILEAKETFLLISVKISEILIFKYSNYSLSTLLQIFIL